MLLFLFLVCALRLSASWTSVVVSVLRWRDCVNCLAHFTTAVFQRSHDVEKIRTPAGKERTSVRIENSEFCDAAVRDAQLSQQFHFSLALAETS